LLHIQRIKSEVYVKVCTYPHHTNLVYGIQKKPGEVGGRGRGLNPHLAGFTAAQHLWSKVGDCAIRVDSAARINVRESVTSVVGHLGLKAVENGGVLEEEDIMRAEFLRQECIRPEKCT
jgi:hypothetical protein